MALDINKKSISASTAATTARRFRSSFRRKISTPARKCSSASGGITASRRTISRSLKRRSARRLTHRTGQSRSLQGRRNTGKMTQNSSISTTSDSFRSPGSSAVTAEIRLTNTRSSAYFTPPKTICNMRGNSASIISPTPGESNSAWKIRSSTAFRKRN